MTTKKTPMRMCTGCREMKPKNDLIRVVRTPEGEVKVDATGKINGRGAYLCKSVECLAKAEKANALTRALNITADRELYATLKGEIEKL